MARSDGFILWLASDTLAVLLGGLDLVKESFLKFFHFRLTKSGLLERFFSNS